jgi:tripartite-type tricarboxylate transporter receptor subunit TctC
MSQWAILEKALYENCSTAAPQKADPYVVLQGNSAAIPTNALQQYSVEALPQPGELDVASYQSCLRDGAEIPIIMSAACMPSAGIEHRLSHSELKSSARDAMMARLEHIMMNLKRPHRRQFLHLATGVAALPTVSRIAMAQTYPSRPVRIVVGFPAGGATDILARLTGQWLSERLGQQFIIENRAGAGGNIGTESVVKASPDGYTLLQIATPNGLNAALYPNLNFNFVRDIAPVIGAMRTSYAMVVHPSVPAATVPEFIAYAKANPGRINMASAGNGTPQHIFGELFKMMAGVNLTHVPYRGGAPATTDLLGGQVQVIFSPLPESIEHIKAGTLRPLAVTTATRLDVLPNIPTVGDFLRGYEGVGWLGLGAPKGTPAEIIDKLNKEMSAGLADPKIVARIAELGGTVLGGAPAAFGKIISNDIEKWTTVIKFAGIKPE